MAPKYGGGGGSRNEGWANGKVNEYELGRAAARRSIPFTLPSRLTMHRYGGSDVAGGEKDAGGKVLVISTSSSSVNNIDRGWEVRHWNLWIMRYSHVQLVTFSTEMVCKANWNTSYSK